MQLRRSALYLVVVALGLSASPASAQLPPQVPAPFVLLAGNVPSGCPPGGPIYRYTFNDTGPLTPIANISGALVNGPLGMVVGPAGELFVGNCAGSTINRFLLNGTDAVPHGEISGNGLAAVTFLTFCPTGELIAADILTSTLSRFLFDASGTAIPNGTIATTTASPQGIACSPWGELFVSVPSDPHIYRFVRDPLTDAFAPAGTFIPQQGTPDQLNYPIGLAFNSSGELFIADFQGNRIYRVRFDATHAPIDNGFFPAGAPSGGGVSGPTGLHFNTATGELFVASQGGTISRFLPSGGDFVPNGSPLTAPGALGDVVILQAKCDVSSGAGAPERCFGGVGSGCDGVPSLGYTFTPDQQTCLVHGWMSTGSILHDQCCNQHPGGYCCGGAASGCFGTLLQQLENVELKNVGSIVSSIAKTFATGSSVCTKEWQDAESDVFCGANWSRDFGPYPAGNTGDDTSRALSAPPGALINPVFFYLCESKRCGKIIPGKLGCRYCVCQ